MCGSKVVTVLGDQTVQTFKSAMVPCIGVDTSLEVSDFHSLECVNVDFDDYECNTQEFCLSYIKE